jgi:hypothetical protein
MPSQAPNDVLLFTKCSNLNTDPCLYGKCPEMVLSLFSDPENFLIDNQRVQGLNDRCSKCDSYQIS